MVDLDESDTPVGAEFAVPINTVSQSDWYALASIVPEVKEIFSEVF